MTLLFLAALLLGCEPQSARQLDAENQINSIQRPSADAAAIITRSLPFQDDNRISYCEVLSNDNRSYSGFRDQKLYPLASLSKVITTAWALKKLGPDHQFQSTWHLKPVPQQPGVFDAYLKTNLDPVFNLEKILYSLALLKNSGVVRLRNLVIDETTRIYLSALSQPHIELEQVPISSSQTVENLKLILNSANWSTQTQAASKRLKTWAQARALAVDIPQTFSVENVELKLASTVDASMYPQKIQITSSTLLKYLKNLNVYSNNYLTDALFSYLGGLSEFRKFQSTELKLTEKELVLYTGSGLADISRGIRNDNLGTCTAMLRVLNYIDQRAAKHQLNLGHFLYNPAQDAGGTFESRLGFTNQVVIKTGRLFEKPTLNLAGITATANGSLYFAFLGHNFSASEAREIEIARDQMLSSSLEYYPTQDTFLSLNEFHIFIK